MRIGIVFVNLYILVSTRIKELVIPADRQR